MFPILHNVNQLIASVNALQYEVQQLKFNQEKMSKSAKSAIGNNNSNSNTNSNTNGSSSTSLITHTHTHYDAVSSIVPTQAQGLVLDAQQTLGILKNDIQKVSHDTTQNLSEMKRYIDAIRQDVTRDITMIETTILRKCESAMHRMIHDKISVALDRERGQMHERIVAEVSSVMATENGNGNNNNYNNTSSSSSSFSLSEAEVKSIVNDIFLLKMSELAADAVTVQKNNDASTNDALSTNDEFEITMRTVGGDDDSASDASHSRPINVRKARGGGGNHARGKKRPSSPSSA
jgi:hypothetical protein